MSAAIRFDDLEDLDGLNGAPRAPTPLKDKAEVAAPAFLGAEKSVATVARFKCGGCRGSGKFYSFTGRLVGNCFRCKGSGFQKTDPVKNATKREAKRRAADALKAQAAADFRAAHPEIVAWVDANKTRFSFAASMDNAIATWGTLTEGQHNAILRCIAQDAERAKARAERKPDADVGGAGFDRMVEAFVRAQASGLRSPKFRVGEYVFSPAKASSTNAGCIYAKHRDCYCGKITSGGKFFAVRETTEEQKAEIARIGADPLKAAVLHGKATGRCSCCGRDLENAESVALGIGPICRAKWGL